MPDINDRLPDNKPGKFYVDSQCIDCDVCRETAPSHFTRNDENGYSYVTKQPETPDDVNLTTLIPAFITSELKTAFIIGFYIYLPFLIIDMVVASTLMSMGMMMLPPITVSLPAKLLLFVLANGWTLLIGSLARGFR